ncbi:hypothetical protein VTJ49DRAFT_1641 [Mycothermus thermophilus]|uniref:Peptidase A1 domain-containing protein n=1 Tax=Humicola insolens TaxID=85995 RepID=A0ABR3VDK9_HUMIN
MAITRSSLGRMALVFLSLFASLLDAIRIPVLDHHHDGGSSNNHQLTKRSVTVDLQRNPNYTPNGPAAYALALSKWGAEVPQKLTQSLAVMGGPEGAKGDVEAASVHDDREYLSRVGFGTPLQWLTVDLDTGWLYTTDTRLSIAQDRRIFHINASSTAEPIANATWYITYGDGSAAWGRVYRDVISLANITIPNATIESATSASLSLVADPDLDGVFGLAYNLSSQTSPSQPSVLSALLPRLAEPVFTADLRWRSSAGAYTFGYVDHERHTDELKYTNLSEGAQFWEFAYRGLHIGGQDRWYLSAEEEEEEEDRWRAIADTGTTLLLMGSEVAELYYADVPGARWNLTVGGIWTYPCNNSVLPEFEIGFDNGFVATIPGQFMNYTAMPDNPEQCMGGLQVWGYDDLAIFGDVFLKAVYAVFDVGQARIGFAPKKLQLTPS